VEHVSAPSVGVEQFTPPFLDGLRSVGDEVADMAVTEFFDGRPAPVSELFSALAKAVALHLDDEDAPGIGAFVRAEEPWPDWADGDLVRRGQQVFGDWGPQLGVALWMASLPADYAGAKGAEPLLRTARLTNNPKRRYLETGQMIIDAMTPGALAPGGHGYRTVRHVRLMHAAIRHALVHITDVDQSGRLVVGPWDDALGRPINQEDLLGCLFSFSLVGLASLERSGVRLDPADAEAYVHVWNLIGHQLGIRDDLLPLDRADAETVFRAISVRQYAPSDAGRELTATAISCMQDMLVSKRLRGLPATGIRHYLGDETADLLGVPPPDWTRAIFAFEQGSDTLISRTVARVPGTRSVTAWMGRRLFHSFERFERGGDRPNFEVTDELRQAWGLDAPD